MARTMDPLISAQLGAPWLCPVFFADLGFDDATLYMHTDLGDISWGGHTWTGAGNLSSIEAIEERADGSPSGTVLRLSGINSTLLNEAVTQQYFGRAVSIYFSVRDASTAALVATPFELFSGQMDQMRVIDGRETSSIELVVESELIVFDSAPMRWFSDSQLQTDYPGDLGFQYLAAMVNLKLSIGGDQTVFIGNHPESISYAPRFT